MLCFALPAGAASTVVLPTSSCSGSDTILRDGFEATPAIPHVPSNGSGGAYPGNVTRTIDVPGLGSRTYYLRLPPDYTPTRSWPLLLALRGQSLPTAAAAMQVRSDWSGIADHGGFIVAAAVGNSTQGGWGANGDAAELSAVVDDAFAHYNVEQSRIYLWGFSAGAHYAHALALDNTDLFAAYGVSAGALTQYACSDDSSFQPTCAALLAGAQPKIPVDIHLGNSDPLYTQYGAGNDPMRFESGGWVLGQNLFYTLFIGGHEYTAAQLGEIWNNICPFALQP
jgi:poly(3-hydroxybutyrate) depolymerase